MIKPGERKITIIIKCDEKSKNGKYPVMLKVTKEINKSVIGIDTSGFVIPFDSIDGIHYQLKTDYEKTHIEGDNIGSIYISCCKGNRIKHIEYDNVNILMFDYNILVNALFKYLKY